MSENIFFLNLFFYIYEIINRSNILLFNCVIGHLFPFFSENLISIFTLVLIKSALNLIF